MCDYNYLAFCFTDESIISNLVGLQLTKQDQGMESPTKTDIELSLDSDPSDKVQEAPVELKGEVYTAHQYCTTCAAIKPLINCH